MSRFLIVEDEAMLVMLLEDMLIDLGHEAAHTAQRLDKGIALAETIVVDAAILDVNLGGERSFPIAEVLQRRGIPFAFATGYGRPGLESRFDAIPVITKPFTSKQLDGVIVSLGL